MARAVLEGGVCRHFRILLIVVDDDFVMFAFDVFIIPVGCFHEFEDLFGGEAQVSG